MLRCCNCGQVFDESEVEAVQEYRGEYWGVPSYETMYYSPCCGDDFYEEVTDDGKED